MPQRRSESIELMTLTEEKLKALRDIQYDIKGRIEGELSDNQLSIALSASATFIGLFSGNAIVAIVGAVSTLASLGSSDKGMVLNSIENGLDGIQKASLKLREDPSRNYIRAYVGFLNYDDLGMRTVSSEHFGFL